MSEDQDSSPRGRPKRCSANKLKKLELLQQIKSGKRNKYHIGELENVYDEVDEREYTKKVLSRQDDDWIVDDGGCGYIEDGREIFDDDLDEESISKQSRQVSTGRKRPRDVGPEKKSGNIRNMLVSMPSKKKKKETNLKLEDDDILGDIIGEIDSGKATTSKKLSTKNNDDSAAKDYLMSLGNIKSTKPKPKGSPEKPKVILSPKKPVIKLEPKAKPKEASKLQNGTHIDNEDDVSIVSVEEPSIIEVKIKEEPIDIDEYGDISADMFGEAMFEAEMQMNKSISEPLDAATETEQVKIKVETTTPERVVLPKSPMVFKDDISEDWTTVSNEEESTNAYINIDKSKLPLTKNEKGDEVLKFFYWDAHEEMFSQPGTVYFFGKVWVESAKTYASCCITIKNIERRIFLLPREKRLNLQTNEIFGEELSMADVYEEFNSKITDKYKIKQFKSRIASKKYVFGEDDIPLESEYLEVRYSASYPALPNDLKGETFSHVFGTKSSFLEILVLERGIKGPCWIEISNAEPVPAPFSWCKIEAACLKANHVNVMKPGVSEIPPLTVVTLHPQAVHNPKTKQSEIVAVGCLVNTTYSVDKPPPEKQFTQHFCVFTKPTDIAWPFDLKESLSNFKRTSLDKIESERGLLNFLLTKLYRIDPDVIVGHDLTGYGIEFLFKRLAVHKVPNWSRFGRLKRSTMPTSKFRAQFERAVLTGRLLCDIKVSAKELIRARSFDLDSLCHEVLNFPENKRKEMNDEEFRSCYYSGENLVKALWWLMTDASYIFKIFYELNILPLALQITNIAGNVMSRTLMGGRSERNEFLLLHAFHNKDYIVPEKVFKKNNVKEDDELEHGDVANRGSKKKPSYAGGLVLDPKVGFYDDFILLMDFNSLYPSIIQEYNICFTTIPASSIDMDLDFSENYHKYLPDDTVEIGILPTEIRKLVESRKGVKALLKSTTSPELRAQYDIRQMALKLTANSMYGCLGFSNSRFCAKGLAAIVTAKGREILLATKKMVEGYSYEVIYGDTDSIMINTKTKDYEQVYQVGRKIKVEVNKCYKQVELDIDGVFKYMLLLKKKKYAAITISKLPNGEINEKKEFKGLDIVRRDWSQLAAAAGRHILNEILSSKSNDDRIEGIHGYLEKIRSDLENKKVPLPLLTVTKQLTKPAEDYSDAKNLPHVLVALRLNKTSAKRLKQGDTVSYIICLDGTNNPATQRAYNIDELRNHDNLSIDVQYYLEQQIHPVISRLCEPIEGIDAASIAGCLGLDPNKYARIMSIKGEADQFTECSFGQKNDERFKDCDRFTFKCKDCRNDNLVDGIRRKNADGKPGVLMLERCANPECTAIPMDYLPYIQNQLTLVIREHIHKYYQNWLVCEDPVCNYRTKRINPIFIKGYPECRQCKQSTMRREISSLSLYNQLCYYQYVFDLKKDSISLVKQDKEIVEAYKEVYDQVAEVLSYSGYSTVNLGALFSQLCPPAPQAQLLAAKQ